MVTIREWYKRANALWPNDVPALTVPESLRATRRLWRYATGSTWLGKVEPVTRSNQYTWLRRGTIYVNHNKIEWVPGCGRLGGWRTFVHDLGHLLHHYTGNRKFGKAHSKQHARLEARLIKQVISRGWLKA